MWVDEYDILRGSPCESGRRLQTSLGLYSSELSAVVLLHEGGVPDAPAALRRAAQPPDHHFPSLDLQLKDIADKVKEAVCYFVY